MKNKANADIKALMKERKVCQWKVALTIGISEQSLIRWLRTELPEEKKTAIVAAIEQLSKEDNE